MTVSVSLRARALAVVASVALALAAAPVAAQDETERVDRTIPFVQNGTLTLKNFSGDVRITGTPSDQVVIKAVRRAPRERLDRIKLEIETSGSSIAINANKREDEGWFGRHEDNNVVKTDFEIELPASTRLTVDVFSSDVRVTGVAGAMEIKSFSGALTLRGAQNAVEAKTFSGAIDVEVTGTTEPDLELETFSGDIDARVPEGSRGRVRFNSFSGDIESDLPLTLRRQTRRSLDADLGSGGGRDLRFKTFSGDVAIRR